ncbi:hypothetical protein TSAR_002917 [Trichomalopsis sarcophagae]|uniref:Uncharacterized protein n=1 Tax=Trichomalopsis sarcophagae TaxID=543379 RepID=A0A232ERD3_9HYME|nr:hypothetical protein TSAR_002917 [Trichomalopsis sarcophagae]
MRCFKLLFRISIVKKLIHIGGQTRLRS